MEIPEYHPFISARAKKEYLQLYDAKAKQWPVPSETRMVDTSYGQTFVRISGPAGASPMVLLSGLGGNSLSWIPQIKALSECYQTYAVDNISDYGRSVSSRNLESQDDFIDWLDELFRALGLEHVNLVGKSYGGWLACQYAYCRPSRLRSVVMMAPAATVLPLRNEFIEHMVKGINSPKDFIFWVYEDFVHKDEASRKAAEEMADENILSARCFNFKPPLSPTIIEDYELQNIKVPALFMVGENEKTYSAQEAVKRLNKVAPQIRTEMIPDAGHDLNLVQAELVAEKVLEFLKQS
jgi:pimeloyl-ACP methyl ester carboxylesterase